MHNNIDTLYILFSFCRVAAWRVLGEVAFIVLPGSAITHHTHVFVLPANCLQYSFNDSRIYWQITEHLWLKYRTNRRGMNPLLFCYHNNHTKHVPSKHQAAVTDQVRAGWTLFSRQIMTGTSLHQTISIVNLINIAADNGGCNGPSVEEAMAAVAAERWWRPAIYTRLSLNQQRPSAFRLQQRRVDRG